MAEVLVFLEQNSELNKTNKEKHIRFVRELPEYFRKAKECFK